jgi:hypothetical protein
MPIIPALRRFRQETLPQKETKEYRQSFKNIVI